MSEEEDQSESSLVMPFVTVKSQGGPHDDAAYVAGWEMGSLDAQLNIMSSLRSAEQYGPLGIHSENKEQADLLAMQYGWTAKFEEVTDFPEWTKMTLWRAEGNLDK